MKQHRSMRGSMQWLNDTLVPLSLLDFINCTLRGISQVIFINNPLFGLFAIFLVAVHDAKLALMATFGCISSTLIAIFLKNPIIDIRNGIFGFGGALCGFAFYVLQNKLVKAGVELTPVLYLPFFFINVLMITGFGNWFSKLTGLPYFTLPYNFSVFLFMGIVYFLYPAAMADGARAVHGYPEDGFGLVAMILVNFGQVFFVDSPVVSFFIFVVVSIFSPVIAFFSILGSVVFIAVSRLADTDVWLVQSGVLGYNVVLTSLVIGGVVHVFSRKLVLISLLGAIGSALVTLALSSLLSPLGLPVLTLPFCLSTILILFVLWRVYPRILQADSGGEPG